MSNNVDREIDRLLESYHRVTRDGHWEFIDQMLIMTPCFNTPVEYMLATLSGVALHQDKLKFYVEFYDRVAVELKRIGETDPTLLHGFEPNDSEKSKAERAETRAMAAHLMSLPVTVTKFPPDMEDPA